MAGFVRQKSIKTIDWKKVPSTDILCFNMNGHPYKKTGTRILPDGTVQDSILSLTTGVYKWINQESFLPIDVVNL